MVTANTVLISLGTILTLMISCASSRPMRRHEKPMDIIIVDSNDPITIPNDVVKKQQEPNFKGSSIPNQFLIYDADHDRRVSLPELAYATDTKIEDARMPFRAADLNKDWFLSLEEFTQAPWIFEAEGVTMRTETKDKNKE